MTYAILFALLAALPAATSLAGAAGAPVGRYIMGGRWPGRLPPRARGLAVVQAGLLSAMALVVLDRASPAPVLPAWVWGAALTLTALSLVANAASPSRPERFWTPVIAGMLLFGWLAGR